MNPLTTRAMRRRLLIGCVVATAIAVPASANAAADYIYWSTGPAGSGAIGRVANAPGATPNASFITDLYGPMQLALLDSRLYWAQINLGAGSSRGIGRAYTDGTDVDRNFLPSGSVAPTGALAASYSCPNAANCPMPYLYYGLESGGIGLYTIARATVDKASVNTSYVGGGPIGTHKPYMLAQKNGPSLVVSWQDMPSGYGLDLLQAGVSYISGWGFTTMGGFGTPGLATDGTYAYWANGSDISRSKISDGSLVSAWVPSAGSPRGIAVDDQYVYWVNYVSGNYTIGRASLADPANTKNPAFISLPGAAYGIAVGSSSGGNSGGGDNGNSGTSGGQATSGGQSSSGGQSKSTKPSNRFTLGASTRRGLGISTRVRVPGAGRVTQVGTRPPRQVQNGLGSSGRVAACSGTRTATKAGTVTVTCRLNAATRAARLRGPVSVRITTTFTPTGGTARSATRTVVMPRLRVRIGAVTG